MAHAPGTAGAPVRRLTVLYDAECPLTAVGDAGQVYRGPAAWVVVLWALRGHRALAHRLATPTGAVLARGAAVHRTRLCRRRLRH